MEKMIRPFRVASQPMQGGARLQGFRQIPVVNRLRMTVHMMEISLPFAEIPDFLSGPRMIEFLMSGNGFCQRPVQNPVDRFPPPREQFG